MRLVDYLDKGASLGADAPCLTMDGKDLSYGDVQRLSYRTARGLANSGVTAGGTTCSRADVSTPICPSRRRSSVGLPMSTASPFSAIQLMILRSYPAPAERPA